MNRANLMDKWLLCNHCIDAIRSRGEELFVSDCVLDIDEAEEENRRCDWCEEFSNLYEVLRG